MMHIRSKRRKDVLNGVMLGALSILGFVTLMDHKRETGSSDMLTDFSVKKQNPSIVSKDTPTNDRTNSYKNNNTFPDGGDSSLRHLISTSQGRPMSRFIPPKEFVVMKEKIVHIERLIHNPSVAMAVVLESSTKYNIKHHVRLHTKVPTSVKITEYITRYPKTLTLRLGSRSSQYEKKKRKLKHVSEYFEYLHNIQGHCRKLIRIGGNPTCKNVGDDKNMDGNKLICFDPEMELPATRDPSSCLVFSYGVNTDISFDEGVVLLPCELHMFDKLDFKPTEFLNDNPHAHFHQTGLADGNRMEFYPKENVSIEVDTLVGQVMKYKLIGRPMHILKMDIEGGEWAVFKSLENNPFLHVVGQIALEVHAIGLLNLNKTEQLEYVQDRYDVMRIIEDQGFRMVAYWDNHQDGAYYDEAGQRHDICGELLYVNTRWYDSAWKTKMRNDFAFKFKSTIS